MLIALVLACSDENAIGSAKDASDSASGATEDTDESTTPTDSTDTGTAPTVPPRWFAVEATLSIAGGVPVASPASVTLTVVGEDATTPICELELPTDAGVAGTPPDPSLWAWWSFTVDDSDTCAVLPGSIGLGVGPMVADLRAVLGASGLDVAADSLYGAYASADGEGPWAFGVAGTSADYAGDDVAAAPLPDGAYQLRPLYLLPLPEQPE